MTVFMLVLLLQQFNFTWARLEYRGFFGEENAKNWYTDFPVMDENMAKLLGRLTNVKARTARVKPSGDLFQYPLIYVVEPEQMNLTDKDTLRLHEYLARGGTLFMDDFHGAEELETVIHTLSRILGKDAYVQELPIEHPLFHSFFDIGRVEQVVNDTIAMCRDCDQWENGPTGRDPKVFGVFDDRGRLEVIMAWNTDLGDGLEWADAPWYPQRMAAYAVRFCVNVVLYTLTH